MKMKRNVLALAISGGMIMAPAAAMAEGPEIYGLIDIGLEHYTNSDGTGDDIFAGFNSVQGNDDDRGFTLSNGMTSRLGVRGSEDLDFGGLVASYNIELQMDVLSNGRNNQNTRLGWAALGGDWGQVKVGTQWQALYEFGGWNTHRTDVHGYGTYYYTTSLLSNSMQYGFRQSSAISYQYGSAWGHSDPFAFNVTLGIGEGENDNELQNEEGVSSVTVAGQYTLNNNLSFNAVYFTEFNSYADGVGEEEPELYNVGARWSVTDALELSANYTNVERDNGDARDSIAIASMMDFGNGLSGHLGFANGSDDEDGAREIDLNTYGYVKQALSDRTNVRLELENIQYDDADDSSATIAMVALQHNF